MIVALLLQAAIAAAPVPAQTTAAPPTVEELVKQLQERGRVVGERSRSCNARVIEAMQPRADAASLPAETGGASVDRGEPTYNIKPLYKPAELPDAGVYAAVERRVDGCAVPTPISLPNRRIIIETPRAPR